MKTTRIITSICLALGLSQAGATESFEIANNGNFTEINTTYGSLKADKDNGAIHNKGKSGSKSLRIHGGENKKVELTIKDVPNIDVEMRAWAERWTGAEPFNFTVSAQGAYGTKEIYNGSKAVTKGGFNTQIKGIVPAKTEKLIFVCTSPEKTGILLDDLYIVPTIPMEYRGTKMESNVWPSFVRLPFNPLLRLDIETEGGLKPMALNEVTLDFSGTNLKGIEAVELYEGCNSAMPENKQLIGSAKPGKESTVTVKLNKELSSGTNYVWVSTKLKDTATVGSYITVKPVSIKLGKNTNTFTGAKTVKQLIGHAVAIGGDTVQPTGRVSKQFRIPGMVQSKKGTLIACTDIRYNHAGDLPADIDMGINRSTDGGQTWSPITIPYDYKEAVEGHKGAGNGDAALLVEEKTGRIWMAVLWSHGGHPIWNSVQGENDIKKVSQFIVTYSDDDGKTWVKPINITDQVRKPEWGVNFQGPGMGICLKDGTLVFPCQYWYDVNGKRTAHASIVYSKDQGKTWGVGNSPVGNTSEAQVVELEDGSIMINSRNEAGGHWRAIAVTKDLGKTWELHPTHNNETGLIEPGSCQGSIITVPNKGGCKHPLFFSNPATNRGRKDMTVKASLDQGMTWPYELMYDERNCAGYSCLAPVDDEHIGVYYESKASGAHDIFFLKIPYAEIFKSKAPAKK